MAEGQQTRRPCAVAEHLKTAARWLMGADQPARHLSHALRDLAAIVPTAIDGIMLRATSAEANFAPPLPHRWKRATLPKAGSHDRGGGGTAPAIFGLGDYAGYPRLAARSPGAPRQRDRPGRRTIATETGEYDFPYQVFRPRPCRRSGSDGDADQAIHGDFRDLSRDWRKLQPERAAQVSGMLIHPDQVP